MCNLIVSSIWCGAAGCLWRTFDANEIMIIANFAENIFLITVLAHPIKYTFEFLYSKLNFYVHVARPKFKIVCLDMQLYIQS